VRRAVIMAGYDGSAAALAAVTWAADEAAARGASLCVVHAVGLLEHARRTGAPVDGEGAVRVAMEHGLERDDIEWRVVDGDPCSALLREADAEHAVLVVVGSRGAGGHAGTLLGSTSLELAEHSAVPVTIVPAGASSSGSR
jgi:nucleotide-binding universal stress UspA family protein